MSAADLAVSIEAEGAEQPEGGHVASGWLVAPDRVMVPEPPPGLLDGSLEVAVLLASAEEDEVERIAPIGVNAVRLAGAEFAVLDLTSASRHAPNAVMPEPVVLEAAIAAHDGDVRKAFESAGALAVVTPRGRACRAHNIVDHGCGT